VVQIEEADERNGLARSPPQEQKAQDLHQEDHRTQDTRHIPPHMDIRTDVVVAGVGKRVVNARMREAERRRTAHDDTDHQAEECGH